MTAPEGTANLIIDYEVEDSTPVKYEKVGNDLVRISTALLMSQKDGLAYIELVDAKGTPIASTEASNVKRHDPVIVQSLRLIQPVIFGKSKPC